MNQLECKKCRHIWTPIVEKPLKCPYCNQPKYWLPKVRKITVKGASHGRRVHAEA